MTCQHKRIRTWFDVSTREPVELWSCAECNARFVPLAQVDREVAEEREACAKECEALRPSKPEYDQRFYDGCTFSANAIRARGTA